MATILITPVISLTADHAKPILVGSSLIHGEPALSRGWQQ
jgi:hypothetical protein